MHILKNDIVELTVESLGYRGEGIARIDRIPVFVNGALPGEKIRAVIILVKKDYYVGKLIEVLVPSIERTEPACPHFLKCGGCNLQHLDYSCQLEYKKQQIKDAFRKIAHIDIGDFEITGSDRIYGYRNKISMPVRNVGGETKVGLYAYNTHRIIETDSCPLQSPAVNSLIPKLRKLAGYFEAFDEENDTGEIKHFMARELGGKISLTVVSRTDISKKLKDVLKQFPEIADEIWLNINSVNSNVILSEKTILIQGEKIYADIAGYSVPVHPNAFLQVNKTVAEKLYSYAVGIVAKAGNDEVIDGYSGCGILTAMLSKKAKHIIGVEIEPDAVESARELHTRLGITNSDFICGDCKTKIPELVKKYSNAMIVLDPPRTGCDERVILSVNNSGAKDILYISCDPATLARDVLRLEAYSVKTIRAFDMFPQTKHVESIVLLQKK